MSGPSDLLLRRVLAIDAAISGASGLLLLAGAGMLAALLGLPESLMRYAGLALIPFAAGVFLLARQPRLSRGAVLPIVVANLAWALGSVWLVAAGPVEPTTLGLVFVLFQAVVVAGFAELQFVGVRRVQN
jgi:hypothetical protein